MQFLIQYFLCKFSQIIKIHLYFLPGFVGNNPDYQADQRAVKRIGTQTYYVPADLEAGLIIEQEMLSVSDRDTPVI